MLLNVDIDGMSYNGILIMVLDQLLKEKNYFLRPIYLTFQKIFMVRI